MKYMILAYGSQRDYDAMAGKSAEHPDLTPDDFAPMYAFMESFNNDLAESGELVDTEVWTPRSTRGGSSCATECHS